MIGVNDPAALGELLDEVQTQETGGASDECCRHGASVADIAYRSVTRMDEIQWRNLGEHNVNRARSAEKTSEISPQSAFASALAFSELRMRRRAKRREFANDASTQC